MSGSNYEVLTAWPALFESARQAERTGLIDPRSSCFYVRRGLELIVEWIYDNDPDLRRPYESHLASLLAAPSFRERVPPAIQAKCRVIRNLGNDAVHGRGVIRQFDGLTAVRELFHVAYWFARTYSKDWQHEGATFDDALIPKPGQAAAALKENVAKTTESLQKLQAELKARDEEIAAERQKRLAESTDLNAQIAAMRQEIADAKKRASMIPDPHDYSEAQTRDYFIDLMLREAGWGLKGWKEREDIEFEVLGMPNESGCGYVDYVLWGDDGKPLALVEAKRTKKDPRLGQQQAKLYADCLEQRFGRRPVIFYTNGYETWIWDDQLYPPRAVQGFYRKDELELLISRRIGRRHPDAEAINGGIAERYYQHEAIREVAKHLAAGHRRALVVMATGAGKTRMVIALVDLLQRCQWVKRALFLADRTALVNQAVHAFKAHLPSSAPVNLVTDKRSTGRVYVSTYPTMMNAIEEVRSREGERQFGPGYFDLIVIDEAHRSVYQKYRAIFEYFDALLVGLTATPRDEVDRDTYGLFELQPGLPTYNYGLEQAVADRFLVPPMFLSVPLKFQREGIKYDDLSDEEKEQWDSLEWTEDGEVPEQIEPEALNRWLFNEDTVDKVLQHLMQNGLTVSGGDRLGKTIVFAKNKDHARFIEERFNVHYPHQRGTFARVIDHYEPYAQSLLDDFSNPDKPPHLAISVDMLDTGIDIPEVVNLVFFKLVRSKTKFFQMVGRGTRLRKDLFGPGQDKQFFHVFDYCQNLEFFGQNPQGIEGRGQVPLGTLIFRHRLDLHQALGSESASGEPQLSTLRAEIAQTLQTQVAAMNVTNFLVRPHRRVVERFAAGDTWRELTPDDYGLLFRDVAPLPSEQPAEDETAKRFDLLMLRTQLSVLQHGVEFVRLRDQVREIAARIAEKTSIPMVASQLSLVLDVSTEEWWTDVTLPMIETARKRLRELVKFIDKAERKIVYSDFEDQLGVPQARELAGLSTAIDEESYRRKMQRFLEAHLSNVAVHKLRTNRPLTPADLEELERLVFTSGDLGTRQDFQMVAGAYISLPMFIRRLIGLDRQAAMEAFAEFLDHSRFTAEQIRFVNFIIDYLTQNGVMPAERLWQPPCTDFHPAGVDGVLGSTADRIVEILRDVERNASEPSAA